MQIERNVGGADRITRLGLGAVLLGTGVFTHMSKPARIATGVLGAIGLATGIAKYCPVSKAFHVNTYKEEPETSSLSTQ